MNLNKFAKEITLKEGGKVNLSIAQVKEVIKLTFLELQNECDDEILRTIKRVK